MKLTYEQMGELWIGCLFVMGALAIPPASAQQVQEAKWEQRANMETPTLGFDAAVLDDKVYAIGGVEKDINNLFNTMAIYDPLTNTWQDGTPIEKARFNHCVETFDGKIYAIGGLIPGTAWTNDGELYDPLKDKWEEIEPMPWGRGAAFSASAVLDGKIYIIGGWSAWQSYPYVTAYDPWDDEWEKKADLPKGTDSGAACSINGKIFHMGGYSMGGTVPISAVLEYDPQKDQWTKKEDMPNPRVGFSLEVHNGLIYAIGGHSPKGTVSVSDVYDPETDEWREPIQIPNPRSWFASVTINGKFYIMGGSPNYDGLGWPPDVVLSLVEELTLPDTQIFVLPNGKQIWPWGGVKR